MGVSGLHTWVEEKARQGALGERVVLQRETTERVVVLDACAGMLTFFGHSSLIGDFHALRRSVAQFVSRFAAVNTKIVVVIDGAVQAEKFSTWLSRRRKEVKTVAELNRSMHGGACVRRRDCALRLTAHRHLTACRTPGAGSGRKRFLWLPPAFSQTYLGQAFRDAGCAVVFTSVEGDRVVAGLAEQLGAFGILGYDSDYLCFPCASLYLDLHSLRFGRGNVSATGYAQRDVLRALGLPVAALPLLACELGFDVHKRSRALLRELARLEEEAEAAAAAAAPGAELPPAANPVDVACAALRLRLAEPHALTARNDREADAMEWYTPVRVPGFGQDDGAMPVARPHVEALLAHHHFVGPLCFEDLTATLAAASRDAHSDGVAGTAAAAAAAALAAAAPPGPGSASVFEATQPLRAAVYARLFGGEHGRAHAPPKRVVTELLCSARRDNSWPLTSHDYSGAAAAAHPADVLAHASASVDADTEAEARAVSLARHVVSTWLAPHLSAKHARALVAQADPATRAMAAAAKQRRPSLSLRQVRPADGHAATLFLIAMDTFLWGAEHAPRGVDVPVWEQFCGPTFHALCTPPPGSPQKLQQQQQGQASTRKYRSAALKKSGGGGGAAKAPPLVSALRVPARQARAQAVPLAARARRLGLAPPTAPHIMRV
jgi:hypothetical protein